MINNFDTNSKDQIIRLLLKTVRPGVSNLINYMEHDGFFIAPASTKFHGCYKGGLADHSLRVYQLTSEFNNMLNLNINDNHIIIAGICHDFCKIGAYIGNSKPYKWNYIQPKGHASLSVERVKQFIELAEIEEKMIKYHMGVYGLTEFDEKKGEYAMRGNSMIYEWNNNPIVKIMYFCDEIATLEEKSKEA